MRDRAVLRGTAPHSAARLALLFSALLFTSLLLARRMPLRPERQFTVDELRRFSDSTAIVILLTAMSEPEGLDAQQHFALYTSALRLFMRSLRATGNSSPVVAMVSAETPEAWRVLMQEFGILAHPVEVLTSVGTPEHYARMVTKLHLWNMTAYATVAYYDVDQIFMRDPAQCYALCAGAPFCAVQDPGIKRTYFNAGFLLLRPDAAEFARLLGLKHLADNTNLAEQDMLNTVYADTWKPLPAQCSYMPKAVRKIAWLVPGILRARLASAVNIHEKFWQLREGGYDGLPAVNESYWPWNVLLEQGR